MQQFNQLPGFNTIKEAANRIERYINRTPVLKSTNLNSLVNADIFFKCENFQKAGAFKSRGAVNAVFSLTERELKILCLGVKVTSFDFKFNVIH